MGVDSPVVTFELVALGRLHELGAGEDATGLGGQRGQEAKLRGRQRYDGFVAARLVAVQIDAQVADDQAFRPRGA